MEIKISSSNFLKYLCIFTIMLLYRRVCISLTSCAVENDNCDSGKSKKKKKKSYE